MTMSRLGYIALKPQTDRTTPVKPTHFIPYKGGDIGYDQEIITNDPIQNVRHKAIEAVKGKITTEGDPMFSCDARNLGYILYGLFGSYSVSTVSAGVYLHTFGIANKLPAFTFEQVKGDTTNAENYTQRSFGVLIDSLELSGSDGIIEAKANVIALGAFVVGFLKENNTAGAGVAMKSTVVEGLLTGDQIRVSETTGASPSVETTTVTAVSTVNGTVTATLAANKDIAQLPKIELVPQTPSFDDESTRPTFSFTHADFRKGDTVANALTSEKLGLEDWSISFENNVEARYGSKRATPTTLAEKGSVMKLKWKRVFENNEDRDQYLGVRETAMVFSLVHDLNIGSSSTPYRIQFECPRVIMTGAEMKTGTDDIFVVDCEAEVYYDSTAGNAVICKVWNDIAVHNA